jgi:hypothetical protein
MNWAVGTEFADSFGGRIVFVDMANASPSRIVFQDRPLPEYASFLDVAANHATVAAVLGEEAAVWWWRFTICGGLKKRESSAVVLDRCERLRRALAGSPAGLADEVARRFPATAPPAVMAEWADALDAIREEAGRCDVCEWTGTI